MQTVTPSSCSSILLSPAPSAIPSTTAVEDDDEASLSSTLALLLGDNGNAESGDTLADPLEGDLDMAPVNMLNASKKGFMNDGELSALILRLKLLAESDSTRRKAFNCRNNSCYL